MSWGQVMSMVGLGMMVGMSGCGSAIGTSIGGAAVVGMLKKKPESFGVGMVLAGLPATQGLYGLVGFIVFRGALASIGSSLTVMQGAVTLGAGIALGLATLISAIKQGEVCANGIAAVGGGHDVFGKTMILAAYPEFYAILSLIAAIMMRGLLGA